MKRIGRSSEWNAAHLLEALDKLAAGRRRERIRGRGVVSDRAVAERSAAHRRCLCDLHAAGYRIRSLHSLNARHLEVIVRAWRARGLGGPTLRTYVSHLKVLCWWLDKPQLVAYLSALIEPERRLAQQPSGVRPLHGRTVSLTDILAAADKVDARFACILALIATFHCTPRAAWLVRPWQLNSTANTRAVVEWARTFVQAPHGSMIPPGDSLSRWKRTFYRRCRAIGLTRHASGITPRLLPALNKHTVLPGSQISVMAGEGRLSG